VPATQIIHVVKVTTRDASGNQILLDFNTDRPELPSTKSHETARNKLVFSDAS